MLSILISSSPLEYPYLTLSELPVDNPPIPRTNNATLLLAPELKFRICFIKLVSSGSVSYTHLTLPTMIRV